MVHEETVYSVMAVERTPQGTGYFTHASFKTYKDALQWAKKYFKGKTWHINPLSVFSVQDDRDIFDQWHSDLKTQKLHTV